MASSEDPNAAPVVDLPAMAASAKQAAGSIAESALAAAFKEMEGAKQTAADGVRRAAEALQGTARGLKSGPSSPAAEVLAEGGDKLHAGSEYLARNSLSGLLFDLGDLTRSRPVLVLGGAFILGLLAGRFLKSQPAEDTVL